jgi:hypothetical protein
MTARSDFWVHVYELASALELEGKDQADRIYNLNASFYALPPIARAELQWALARIVTELREVDLAIRQGPIKSKTGSPKMGPATSS